MGWPIPAIGRGLVVLAALLIPLVIALALLPALLAWPFLPYRRQRSLHRLLDMVLARTTAIVTDPRQLSGAPRRSKG